MDREDQDSISLLSDLVFFLNSYFILRLRLFLNSVSFSKSGDNLFFFLFLFLILTEFLVKFLLENLKVYFLKSSLSVCVCVFY